MMIRAWCVALLLCLAPVHAGAAQALRIATANFPEGYGNPFSSVSVTYGHIFSALFDPLTFVNSAGDVLPWLAISWQQEAPTRWAVKLRPGVTFSNGEPLTAEAVVTAIAYLKTDAGRRDAVSRDLAIIADARARDDLTVEFDTQGPDPMLPRELSLLRLVAPKAWKALGPEQYAKDPIGTGPYRMIKRTPTLVTLAAVPTSWRKAPASILELHITIDPAARRTALLTGQVDIVNTAIAPDEVDEVEAAGGMVYYDRLPSVVAIAFNNVKSGPLQDRRVRQALNYAVDKETINRVLWAGKTDIATQMAAHSAFGFNKAVGPYPYDPAKARALLAEAGYPNGFAFDFEGVTGTVVQADIFQKVADDLAKVGVIMTIQMVTNAKFLENQQTGEWRGTAAAIPYFSPTFDPLYAVSRQTCDVPHPFFCDRDISALVTAARAEPDLERRRVLTEKIMGLTYETGQGLFLYDTVTFVGLGKRVASFHQDFGFIRYEMITLK